MERALGLPLEIRHGQERGHNHGGEELEIVRVELEPEDEHHNEVIHDAAEDDKAQAHGEVAALAEERVAQHLADDDGGEANDNRAAAHVDVGKALVLRHQAAGERDHAVGERQAEHLHGIDVDALRAAHRRVGARGADGAALLGAEVPVEERDEHGREQQTLPDRAGHAAQRQKQAVLIRVDRGIGLHAHDAQVDRVERELRQDAGEDGRNAELRVQQAGHETREQTRDHGREQRRPCRPAGDDEHDRHGAAGGERPVDRQIGDIEQAERDVHAQGHDAPDDALGNAAGQTRNQIRQAQGRKNQ